MPAPSPEPGPEEEQSPGVHPGPDAGAEAREVWGGWGWAWVEGSADTAPVRECPRPGPQPDPPTGDGLPAGLDYAALVEGLAASGVLGGDADDQDAEWADFLAAEAEGRLQPADPAAVAAQAVEHMPPGAAQAGWLEVAAGGMDRLDENALIGIVLATRQQQARMVATHLSAVARLCMQTAQADPRIGLRDDGRPARVSRDAVGQIEMALKLTHYQAEELADLAATLTWRLPATGRALATGAIDLDRAKLIAETTSVLTEDQARAVEKKILPAAGGLTRPFLRERLTRAVINADPQGADKRRERAERRAMVSLYGDQDGTATLVGSNLPAVHAAAAMARITAIARAMKAAGQAGGLDLHRAQVMIGLLLGTLPRIPPAPDAPPDQPPPGDDDSGPADDGDIADGDPPDGLGPHDSEPRDDLPAPRDEDAPPDDGIDDHDAGLDEDRRWDRAEEDDDVCGTGPLPAWPALGAIWPALARRPAVAAEGGRPMPGLLDATVPWATLAGLADTAGTLGRIGPVTAAQARLLAQAAEADPAAQWRVIVTNSAGQAIAVTRIRRPRSRDGPSSSVGLVGRITVTITKDTITAALQQAPGSKEPGSPGGSGPPGGIAAVALRAANRALDRAQSLADADAVAGGCAHTDQSPGYRPPPRLREFVIARDVTCRSPVCRQPAWRADLDHTRPYDHHGRTCRCNLGGGCRRDHQLKQHPRWRLEQPVPGVFQWTTPAGRTYQVGPDTHPV